MKRILCLLKASERGAQKMEITLKQETSGIVCFFGKQVELEHLALTLAQG